jgi:hypothetical protein
MPVVSMRMAAKKEYQMTLRYLLSGAILSLSAAILPATLVNADTRDVHSVTLMFVVPGTAGPTELGGTGYVDTGFTLQEGVPIVLQASGTVDYCGAGGCTATANGVDPSLLSSSCIQSLAAPTLTPLSLIATVGGGAPTLVGEGPTTITGSGPLLLGVNDCSYSDNAGSLMVSLTYECQPGTGNGDENHLHCGPPMQPSSLLAWHAGRSITTFRTSTST